MEQLYSAIQRSELARGRSIIVLKVVNDENGLLLVILKAQDAKGDLKLQ